MSSRKLYIPSLAEIITGDYARIKQERAGDYTFVEPGPVKTATAKGVHGLLSRFVGANNIKDYTGSTAPNISSQPAGGSVSYVDAGSGTVAPVPNYLNADLAKAYGMDASTAYQEALSNTSYQRSVKDMQAAGLNPAVLFGAHAASGASGVNYVAQLGSSGGTSGLSSGVSSGRGLHSWYNSLSNVGTIVGSVVGKGRYGSQFAGKAIGGAIGNIIDSLTSG